MNTELTEMPIPKIAGYENKRSDLVISVGMLAVNSEADLQVGADLRSAIAAIRAEISRTFDPLIHQANKTHKLMIQAKKDHDKDLAEADYQAKSKMEAYHDEIERKQREAIEKEKEALRQAQRKKQEEEDRLAREAEEARAAGEAEKAQALEEQAAAVESEPELVLTPPPAPPKVEGSSARKLWSAEVRDFMALVKAVAEGKAPEACLLPNQKILDARARSEKEQLQIPGVMAKSRSNVMRR